MTKWSALLSSCLALGLVAAGCGGEDNDKSKGAGAATSEQPAQQKPAGAGARSVVAVTMKDIKFVPMNVKVKAGGTITWTNEDPFAHTVTKVSGPGAQFDSGTVKGGATFKLKFDTPGKIDYVCTIHPNQTGTITVE